LFKNFFGKSTADSSRVLDGFRVNAEKLLLEGDKIPLTYWVQAPNFGDLLSPWLFNKLTGKDIKLVRVGTDPNKALLKKPTYISIGSILSRVQDLSIVWGSGSFGTEQARQISKKAKYHAVRGPLTRSLVMNQGGECPAIYGDPALLSPVVYNPSIKTEYEIGLVLRWSESEWLKAKPETGVRIIDLGTDDIEGVISQMKSCKRIITSSLHGLIIADAYGIPNAWLSSGTPKGGEFKFYDYFLSVNKVRHAQTYNVSGMGIRLDSLLKHFDFDGRPITFEPEVLLSACPFLDAV
tara:strand:- start:350 stop:1231 length:882 start_codon:yes stop_codon:yes gene_type:complete